MQSRQERLGVTVAAGVCGYTVLRGPLLSAYQFFKARRRHNISGVMFDLPAHEAHPTGYRCIKVCIAKPKLIHMAGQEGLLRMIESDETISVRQALPVEIFPDTLVHRLQMSGHDYHGAISPVNGH